jgi:hypothetical protein
MVCCNSREAMPFLESLSNTGMESPLPAKRKEKRPLGNERASLHHLLYRAS